MRDGPNEYLEHQTKEFRDSDGSLYSVRVEQGGGEPAAVPTDPPVPVLIFRPTDDARAEEFAIGGDAGNWDLSAYSDERLRALLAQAQSRANGPSSE
jgi:hypothetical protein